MKLSPISGRAAAPGIAIGRIWKVPQQERSVPHISLQDTETTNELDRLKKSFDISKSQLKNIQNRLCRFQAEDHAAILESHLLFLKDPLLYEKIKNFILHNQINAEWALERVQEDFKKQFSQMTP